MKELSGKFDATGLKIAVVVSRFNEMVTERLLAGALGVLERAGAAPDDITVVRVPGSFELPVAAQQLAAGGKFQAVVCLGALIRGETDHYDYLAREVTRGIGEVALRCKIPVTYGVITAESSEQALNRAGLKHGNKGVEAAVSAIEMAALWRTL